MAKTSITEREVSLLETSLEQLSNDSGLEDLLIEVGLGLGRSMRHKSHNCMSAQQYEDEYYSHQILLEFLLQLLQIRSKYNCTPEFSIKLSEPINN